MTQSSEGEAWLTADTNDCEVEEMNDEQIISVALREYDIENPEEDQTLQPAVGHAKAESAFATGMSWLEQQLKATRMNLLLLQLCNLQTLASTKKVSSLKITDDFKQEQL